MYNFTEFNLTADEMDFVAQNREHFINWDYKLNFCQDSNTLLAEAVAAHDNKYTSEKLEKFMRLASLLRIRDEYLAVAEKVVNSADPVKAREAEIAETGACRSMEELENYVALGREKLLEFLIKQDEDDLKWLKAVNKWCDENGMTYLEYLGVKYPP